jgi:hypothetical protein
MARRNVGRRTLRGDTIDARLRALERTEIKTAPTPKKQALAKHRAILLIGTLGFGKAAKEVEQGKHTAAETLTFISNSGLVDKRRQQIARLGAIAARKEGF